MGSPEKQILIAGAGFAGMYSALGAVRLLDQEGGLDGVEVAVIAPEPVLHIRPRLHEATPESMQESLLPLFQAVGVRFIKGKVTAVRPEERTVEASNGTGEAFTVGYDRLVLATGSRLHFPAIPGLREFAYNIDQTAEAHALDEHLRALASLPASDARDTVVVAGGGFTGIEIATELPGRLRDYFGGKAIARVVIVEQAEAIGPDLGPGPRPVIEQALADLGVETVLGSAVASVAADRIVLADGTEIATRTVIWTGGMRASGLTEQLPGERDRLGRLVVTPELRLPGAPGIFAAGDTALARTDDDGHETLMSCQHAMATGRFAGHNAAADLLSRQLVAYRQKRYVTCLDLGGAGAVFSEGWDRQVRFTGEEANAIKRRINTRNIYPPPADREKALAAADLAAFLDVK